MDFRNITNLADHESPSFAEYESCFEGEGFEDFGSWNPVSIDDIITNCQQFEVDDDKTRSLDVLRAVATGPTLSADSEGAIDFRDDEMRGVVGNDTASLDPTLEWPGKLMLSGRTMKGGSSTLVDFRDDEWRGSSAVHQQGSSSWTSGKTHFSSSKPTSQRPTCYAPLFPIVHMPTHFQTHFELELAVPLIEETLKEKEVSFRFIASECTWNCSYLNNASHGSFVVRVYRFPAKLGNPNHVVEMQRLDGDAWIFRSIYETLNEKLRDERIEEAVPIWPRPADWPAPATTVETADASESLAESSKPLIEADEAATASTFEVPSMANLKSVIVATLRHGRLSAVVESTQLACSIYSEKALGDPEEVDVDCMKELMKIVNESETNSDWASQHAVWALASMSLNTKYCQKMLATGQLGIDFLQAMLALGVPGTFSTEGMRCKCVELLNNLVGADPDYVFSVLGESEVSDWQEKDFVKEVLRNGSSGRSIG